MDDTINSGSSSERIEQIDILKALTIILIVAGHAYAPFTHFFYLFHVSVFFIASGYTYKDKYYRTFSGVLGFIKGRIKRLYIPYFVWNAVFTLLNNLFIRINVYTDDPRILEYVSGDHDLIHSYLGIREVLINIVLGLIFKGNTQMGVAFWFIKILFMVSVIYVLADFLLYRFLTEYRLLIQIILSVCLLAFGYVCNIRNIQISPVPLICSCYWLFCTGNILGTVRSKYASVGISWKLTAFVISFAVLVFENHIGTVYLANNEYINPVYFIFAGISGWVFLYVISDLAVMYCSAKIRSILNYIGAHTLSILALQFLAFKPVAYLITRYYELPGFCVAAFPNLYGDRGAWWLLYIVAGVMIPLGADFVFHRLISRK